MDTTLVKGLTVLEALAHSPAPRGVSDLARELDLTKSNVHRTLQTLIAAGYVRAGDRPGTYACSLKLFELASSLIARVDVRQCAEPSMAALADATRETVHLSVLDAERATPEVIYLHKIESPEPVRAYSAIGGRAPAHCVASGKALLAYQGDAFVADLPETLPGFTPRSLTTRDALRTEITAIRRRGYAVNQGEWRASVCGLAAIILDAGRRPVASIGISGPVDRLRPTVLRRHRDVVVEAAREISAALGCAEYTPVREQGGART
ncbi:MAG TPA: IclR family transcriptional regulator [Streptosporangiaceae bacterium]|jgi:DNA-binding IclR family transcriptional regulator